MAAKKKAGRKGAAVVGGAGGAGGDARGGSGAAGGGHGGWTFLSNHAHVLICLAGEADMRLRDVAERVGITERGVQKIVAELEEAGILVRHREGRRNRYEIHADVPLRHPVEAHRTVKCLIEAVLGK